jgi:hypothetical protein
MSQRSLPGRLIGGVLGVLLPCALGCQTWLGGKTLPSAYYLNDPPDVIAKGPMFPLAREYAEMQAAAARQQQAGGAPGAAP